LEKSHTGCATNSALSQPTVLILIADPFPGMQSKDEVGVRAPIHSLLSPLCRPIKLLTVSWAKKRSVSLNFPSAGGELGQLLEKRARFSSPL